MELISFGPGIWSLPQMAVLLFHAERSTRYGKDADTHSVEQATDGIWSKLQGVRVRGPAGVSRSTWKRTNNELAIDPAAKLATGNVPRVLQILRRYHASGADAPTEYAIDWLAVAHAIATYRCEPKPLRNPAQMSLSTQDRGVEGSTVDHRGVQAGPLEGSTVDHPPTVKVGGRGVQPGPHKLLHGGSEQLRPAHHESASLAPDAIELLNWLESAWGAPLQTWLARSLPGQILAITERCEVYGNAVFHFLAWVDERKKAASYNLDTPAFFAHAAAHDLIRWARTNHRIVTASQREREEENTRRANSPTTGELIPITPPAEPAAAQLGTPPDIAALARAKRFGGAHR